MKSSSKVYQVVSGEPHLGRVRETVVEIEREEIVEALVETLLDGMVDSSSQQFVVSTGNYDNFYLDIDEYLDQDEIDYILREMRYRLLDDDYGSGTDYDLVYDLVDEYVHQDANHEFETQEYM